MKGAIVLMDSHKTSWPGWETVGIIGRGSFGAVYEIQRDVLGDVEKAALKVISIPQHESDIDEMYSDGYDDESITSTFQNHLKSIVAEYTLMKKMSNSANIVHSEDVRYVQHENGFGWDIFIKMELLTPLTKALPADIPEETVVKLAKDMCAALELCRKHGIVHRDIKPQNIFLSPDGNYKLGDFGIAKTVEKTMGGTKIGTYRFMAPEVYNNQPYGMGADIYSLGLVLYWMLNERRMPFLPLPPEKLSSGVEERARNRRFSGEPLPPPAHGSADLKKIVLKACAFDPKERYSSAAEMLQDLNEGFGSEAVRRRKEEERLRKELEEKLRKEREERERLLKEQERARREEDEWERMLKQKSFVLDQMRPVSPGMDLSIASESDGETEECDQRDTSQGKLPDKETEGSTQVSGTPPLQSRSAKIKRILIYELVMICPFIFNMLSGYGGALPLAATIACLIIDALCIVFIWKDRKNRRLNILAESSQRTQKQKTGIIVAAVLCVLLYLLLAEKYIIQIIKGNLMAFSVKMDLRITRITVPVNRVLAFIIGGQSDIELVWDRFGTFIEAPYESRSWLNVFCLIVPSIIALVSPIVITVQEIFIRRKKQKKVALENMEER